MAEALYLFCLARTDQLDNFAEPEIFLHPFSGISAVLSRVSTEEFCGAEAEAHMQELAWITPRAHRHQQVIEKVMRHSPVLPARFATLFSSQERLENFLAEHTAAISKFLTNMVDKEEWAVKGLLDRTAAIDKLAAEQIAQAQLSEAPGKRYFQERRIRMAAEKQVNSWLKQVCTEIADELKSLAVDFSKRQVLDTEMVVNWAFLVPSHQVTEFCAKIEQLNVKYAGLVFEYSGPWPPYSFSSSIV